MPTGKFAQLPRLMAITPGTLSNSGSELNQLCRTLSRLSTGGVRLFQFREKQLNAEAAELAFTRCKQATGDDALWLVNGGVSGAPDLLTDGLHMPADHPRPGGSELLLGYSVHSLDELSNASAAGVHYVTASPVFPPSTKPVSGRGVSWLRTMCNSTSLLVYALGGVTPERAIQCLEAGAHGVAVLSGLMHTSHPEAATRAYLQAIGE